MSVSAQHTNKVGGRGHLPLENVGSIEYTGAVRDMDAHGDPDISVTQSRTRSDISDLCASV